MPPTYTRMQHLAQQARLVLKAVRLVHHDVLPAGLAQQRLLDRRHLVAETSAARHVVLEGIPS